MSKTANCPVRRPDSVGVNVTLIAQLAPAASRRPHVFCAIAKSPTATVLVIVRGAELPLTGLVSVTVWGPLVVPIAWLANVRLAGDRIADGVVRFGPLKVSV